MRSRVLKPEWCMNGRYMSWFTKPQPQCTGYGMDLSRRPMVIPIVWILFFRESVASFGRTMLWSRWLPVTMCRELLQNGGIR